MSRVWGVLVLGLVLLFVLMQLPADGGVSGALEEIGGLLIPLALMGTLVAVYARNQLRARRRQAASHDEYVVGPQGEVRQLGAPHSGYLHRSDDDEEYPVAAAMRNLMANPQANRPAPARPAAPKQAAARPAPPRQAAPAPPPAPRPRAPRPAPSSTRALSGSCLFSHEWQPSALQNSSLHRSE